MRWKFRRDGMDGLTGSSCRGQHTQGPLHTRIGVPTRLRQLGIAQEDLRDIANETVKNFNANAGVRSADDQIGDAFRLLEAAY